MAYYGSATINFGAAPGSLNTSVVVTGQIAITTGSIIEAWIMADTTADHSADEHALVPIRVTCGNIVASTSFTIYAYSDDQVTGQFNVRWVWI